MYVSSIKTKYVVGCLTAVLGGCTADRAADGREVPHWSVAASAGSLDIFAVQLFDARAGLAAGDIDPKGLGGRLYETSDGGHTWRAGAARTEIVTGLHFADATTGWAAGYAGHIDRTDDGGRTWRAQRTEMASEVLNAIYAIDESHVWAIGARGLMLRTDDGGRTWNVVDGGHRQDLWAIRFVSPTRGWIAGDRGLLLETSDAGDHWTPVGSGTTRTLYGIAALPPSIVVAVGEAGTVVRSVDGRRWEATSAGGTTLNSVAAAKPGLFWAAGDRGTLAGSSDAGKTWEVVPPPTTVRLSAIALADERHGIAAGKRGVTLVLE